MTEWITERERFEKAWAMRPWLLVDESDKDRAWRWWQTALQPDEETRHDMPLIIRKTE